MEMPSMKYSPLWNCNTLTLIESLTEQMKAAAGDLQFELAARLRDEIRELKRELRSMDEAGH